MDVREQLQRDVERFQELTRLGDHRIGMILVSGGMFVKRMRAGGRFFPETIDAANKNLVREIVARDLDQNEFHCFKHEQAEFPEASSDQIGEAAE
ncbi:hypothetical protein [Shimia sp.]|uniref:hypothetical protein n=1 Tax=Shimia sp. TaxID=1954381 RepID=UPI003B8BD5B3